MAKPHRPPRPSSRPNKRKDPHEGRSDRYPSSKRPKLDHRGKQREARQLITQTTSEALKNGELDVDKFIRAREFEIRALDEGMARSRKALNRRAFQQVPKELRRRTASHNVKKVPKRLRVRATKEMLDDNTPTVTPRRRKPTGHTRLRLETARKLRALGAKERHSSSATLKTATASIRTRVPKIKKATLATPPLPKAKFRKRQIHKSWLPTHLYHAKRAHMTQPSAPLWRFSIPLTMTQKSYRATHRASTQRGCVAWDVSYMSTIGLEGRAASLESVLAGLGVAREMVGKSNGAKWRSGKRVYESWVHERNAPHRLIAPATIIWCASGDAGGGEEEKMRRKMLLRIHPSAFRQLWMEVVRLAKVAKPQVSVEDLRFEIGSIEITGPGSTEALLGALWPSPSPSPEVVMTKAPATAQDATMAGVEALNEKHSNVETVWTSLAGLANTGVLPRNALLGFDIQDPRLHHPPRTISLPRTDRAHDGLLDLLANWPIDQTQRPASLFDSKMRRAASASLASQKSINRRKALARPGRYPDASTKDPRIPILLYTNVARHSTASHTKSSHAAWTLLLPWKCVQPVWYSLLYYPLSMGQQTRCGGLNEMRQLAFEAGLPWFPADFPATQAGWEWEVQERRRRYEDWKRRPPGKRISWDKVDVGNVQMGEIGVGWGCAWEALVGSAKQQVSGGVVHDESTSAQRTAGNDIAAPTEPECPIPAQAPHTLSFAPGAQNHAFFRTPATTAAPTLVPDLDLDSALVTVRLTLLARGTPSPCARIYRLPSASSSPANLALRRQWLALAPPNATGRHRSRGQTKIQGAPGAGHIADAPPHIIHRELAAELLAAERPEAVGGEAHLRCPDAADLVGFVTTGGFNLRHGRGTGIGSLVVGMVRDDDVGTKGAAARRLCVVRNAGEAMGRLARWELV